MNWVSWHQITRRRPLSRVLWKCPKRVVDRDEDEDEDEDEDKDDYVPPWLIGRGHCAQDPQHEKLMYIMYGSKLSPHGSMFGSYMGRY
jgi:hypothetical protein